jgi:hypothetical protein
MGSGDPGSTVFIKRCEDDDRERIKAIVAEGMACFDCHPRGEVTGMRYLQDIHSFFAQRLIRRVRGGADGKPRV